MELRDHRSDELRGFYNLPDQEGAITSEDFVRCVVETRMPSIRCICKEAVSKSASLGAARAPSVLFLRSQKCNGVTAHVPITVLPYEHLVVRIPGCCRFVAAWYHNSSVLCTRDPTMSVFQMCKSQHRDPRQRHSSTCCGAELELMLDDYMAIRSRISRGRESCVEIESASNGLVGSPFSQGLVGG